MARLAPTSLRLIVPEWVHRVPAPAHDTLTPAERRRYIAENPHSYLSVTRSPEDLAPGEVWDPKLALLRSRSSLDRLINDGAFGALAPAGFYLYRLTQDDHAQVGVVTVVATDDYDRGQVRIHERIRENRVQHLATQLGGLGVQSSPIALAYRPNDIVQNAIERAMSTTEPSVDFTAADGVGQQVWPVMDNGICVVIQEALATAPLYLIDGHHRAAAASQLRRHSTTAGADWILAAIFSADDLRNEAFHRSMPGTDGPKLLELLKSHIPVRRVADLDDVVERRRNELALLVPNGPGPGDWYLVTMPEVAPVTTGSAAEQFLAGMETVRLEQEILGPLLGIDASDAADRITFRHGLGDKSDLEGLQAESADPIWVMRPVAVEKVMDASDVGAILPPKSTYFRPKVRSGVFVRPLD